MVLDFSTAAKERDFRWQDQFTPDVMRLAGEHIPSSRTVIVAPDQDDMRRNTDLMITASLIRVSVRIRQHKDLAKYGDEFTIRSKRDGGPDEVELHKAIAGWGDYIFYAFATADETGLAQWLIGDLKRFRLWHSYELARRSGKQPGVLVDNHDGSYGRAYKIADQLPGFIVAHRLDGRDPGEPETRAA
jgi:hypothetical protein